MAEEAIDHLKACRKCGICKPATSEFFYSDKSKKSGIRNECRDCAALIRKQRWKACDQAAARERAKKWKAENKDRVSLMDKRRAAKLKSDPERLAKRREWERHNRLTSEARKKWRADRAEELKEYYKKWRTENIERAKEFDRLKYEHIKSDPDLWAKENARKLQWARDNPEKHKAKIARRRARIAKADGTHTAQDLKAIIQKQSGECFYCYDKLVSFEFDHFIPISRGGSNWPDNLVAACKRCNASKGNKMPWEWQPDRFKPPS